MLAFCEAGVSGGNHRIVVPDFTFNLYVSS